VDDLTVYQRATICNMTQELGATSGLFPSDTQTRRFLSAQGSESDWRPAAVMFLGIRAVLALSYARIHESNLVNFAIPPLRFVTRSTHDAIAQGDLLELLDVMESLEQGREVIVRNVTRNEEQQLRHALSARQLAILLAGGLARRLRAEWGLPEPTAGQRRTQAEATRPGATSQTG
jgi:aconitase A